MNRTGLVSTSRLLLDHYDALESREAQCHSRLVLMTIYQAVVGKGTSSPCPFNTPGVKTIAAVLSLFIQGVTLFVLAVSVYMGSSGLQWLTASLRSYYLLSPPRQVAVSEKQPDIAAPAVDTSSMV